MNKIRILFFIVPVLIISGNRGFSQEMNWTHFRGSHLDCISEEKNAPLSWSDSLNIRWKADIEGKGWSSPVVFGNQVWVTTATPDGKWLKAVCIDFTTGRELYNLLLFEPVKLQGKHAINTFATPTCCIEKGFVYVTFGTYGTACINTINGQKVWERTDLNCLHVQGSGSSLMLYKDLLIVHCEGTDQQYIVGLDKATGKTLWRADRPKELYDPLLPIGKKAYVTPIIVKVNGKDLLISNGSAVCIAYDPETGSEVWRFVQGEDSTIAMPFSEGGIVYFITSFVTPKEGNKYAELIAVKPDGTGDIAGSHVVWRKKLPVIQLLTPLIKDGLIYMVDTENNLLCIDAENGNEVYRHKMKSKYNSSPVYAGGNIYFTSVKGETMVVKQGRNLEIISENRLSGEVFATPAILRKVILVRTDKSLFCVSD